MTDTPDREISFRPRETEGDIPFEDADDTLPDRRRGCGDAHLLGSHGMHRNRDDSRDQYFDQPQHRMSVKPEQYDGTEDWEEYISHFEICAELGRWREQDKVLSLAAALKGPARTFYISLSIREKRTYEALVQRLGQRFGSTRQQNRWLSRLEMRKRKPGETVAALADDLRQMAQRAYTDLDGRAQEVLALNQLYKSVPPEVKYQCTNQDCKTVTEAVEVIERYEAILGDGMEKKKPSVRMVSDNGACQSLPRNEDNNQVQETIQSLTRRVAELEHKDNFTEPRPVTFRNNPRQSFNRNYGAKNDRKEIKCFLCDEPGHICRNCPIYLRCKGEQQKRANDNRQPQNGNINQNTTLQSTARNQGNLRRPLSQ